MIEQEPERIWPKDELVGGVRREDLETNLQKGIEGEHPGEIVVFDGREDDPTAMLDLEDRKYLLRLFRIYYPS